ncbi:MAG: hypothetical protein PWQ17_935 [Anaerophaga sp.]|nr:hypothetical protein [Anaerophaga sp.]MDN5291447.1 hypothetical protein [Anaerophaga sp.]
MRILYAIQGTGNGHVARAIDLVPEFQKYGDVDVLLSGQHSELKLPFEVKYRFQGFGFFFGQTGGVDIARTWHKNSIARFFREIINLPVEQYDLVISDFEPVSAWACIIRRKKCFGMSHQAAVADRAAPHPNSGSWLGKTILKCYAPVCYKTGFHFKRINEHISTPVIRKSIREVIPRNMGHYTVYLPAYSDIYIIGVLAQIRDVQWEVFSKNARVPYSFNNISVFPVDDETFVKSMTGCTGVLCNAGFETPAEALFLEKKLCVIPMKHQYEQACNAEMLKIMGIPVLSTLSSSELPKLKEWLVSEQRVSVQYPDNVAEVAKQLILIEKEQESEISFKQAFPFISFYRKIEHIAIGKIG